jgi:hypothetical protein
MQLTKLVATRKVASSITASVLSIRPCKNISQIQVLVITFFPTPPIKLKPGLQVVGTWKATNSNPVGPTKLSSQSEKENSE